MTQSARAPRQLPEPSAPAQPEFQWEPFSGWVKEAQPLLKRHWEELALDKDTIPFDPDWDAYFALERVGRVFVLTARVDRHLVGYFVWIVSFLMHSRLTQWAQSDVFWLDPAYRVGLTGIHLLKLGEEGMRAVGCQRIDISPRLHFEVERGGVGRILERIGYTPIETTYSKVFPRTPA